MFLGRCVCLNPKRIKLFRAAAEACVYCVRKCTTSAAVAMMQKAPVGNRCQILLAEQGRRSEVGPEGVILKSCKCRDMLDIENKS